MRPDTYQRHPHTGAISIGGVCIESLANRWGTPLYVLDYETMVARMRAYQHALSTLTPPGMAFYAGKAFLCRAMVETVKEQGLGLDVVSGGELYTAVQAGFDAAQIMFHGNVKTSEELEYGLKVGVGQFVVDSLDELERLNRVAQSLSVIAPVLLRLTPGIDAHTHDFIRTGQFDSKFGFGMVESIADTAVEKAMAYPFVSLNGFHAHIGSQILESEPFIANAEALLRYSAHWHQKTGFWPKVLDIGGGLGVHYAIGDEPPAIGPILSAVQSLVIEHTPVGNAAPRIVMEPGRSIVAEAGVTIYTIESRKKVIAGKTYVAVDGGMGDNIRPALYQAQYAAEIDSAPEDSGRELVSVAGRYCESGDILIHNVVLCDPRLGRRLVVFSTGAYNYSMASSYNRVPRPAVVMVRDGLAYPWVKREGWEDMIRLDVPLHAPQGVRS